MNSIISKSLTRIYLIRHGHTKNPDSIFYGRLPGFKLDHKGRQEASLVSKIFKDIIIDGLYSSPMLRARQTANIILKFQPQLRLKISSLITEVFSVCQGKPSKVLSSHSWDIYAGHDSKYEQPEDVIRRTQKFLHRIRKRHYGKHVAAVTHGDVILFVIFWAKNISVTPANKLKLNELGILSNYPATGSITTLTYQTNNLEEIPNVSYSNLII